MRSCRTNASNSKVEGVSGWDGSGAVLHQKMSRPAVKRKLLVTNAQPKPKKRKTKRVELEKKKSQSIARAKEIIFGIFPKKMKLINSMAQETTSKRVREILGKDHDHMKQLPRVALELRQALYEELMCLMAHLDELQLFLVYHEPILEETTPFGMKVQLRIRLTCISVQHQVRRIMSSLPAMYSNRAELIVRMRKHPDVQDNYEGLKGNDELHILHLKKLKKSLFMLYCVLFDLFQKNWNNLVDPDSLRKDYQRMIC